jgi:hypothetical protein
MPNARKLDKEIVNRGAPVYMSAKLGVQMICRTWRGWTTPENADAYESVVRGQVIPGIEAMRIPGFLHIDLMRRDVDQEVEFLTAMWFEDVDSIKAFVGEDSTVSHVPPEARGVLARYDDRSAHYVVVDRRPQAA